MQIFSKIYNFVLALSREKSYTIHSESEVFTFSEDLKMEWFLLILFWCWLLKEK